MLNLFTRVGVLLLLLLRPMTIFAVFCFFAGGIATLKSDYVHQKMVIVSEVWDKAIQPDLDSVTSQAKDLVMGRSVASGSLSD